MLAVVSSEHLFAFGFNIRDLSGPQRQLLFVGASIHVFINVRLVFVVAHGFAECITDLRLLCNGSYFPNVPLAYRVRVLI